MRFSDDGGNAVRQMRILLGMSELHDSLQTPARRLLRVLFVRDIHVSANGCRSGLLPNLMTRKNIKWIVAAFVVLGIAVAIGYQFTGGREYSNDMNALRAQFNADKGKVRLLLLLSPT
jgi:hypothetical protein